MSNARKLFRNTLLLTAASFIIRTVAVSFNVYLSNKIGENGIGLFQLIFSVYTLAITFACSGIRLASMRLTADNISLARGNERHIMRSCMLYAFLCGLVTATVLFACSGFIGAKWIGDPRSIRSLKILCMSLPFVSISASLGGYFTAIGRVGGYTVIQLADEGMKIIVTVLSLKKVAVGDLEGACAAVTLGIAASEVFFMISSLVLYNLYTDRENAKKSPVLSKLLRIAVPDAIGSQMRSILMTVEHLLIPVGLRKSGSNQQTALAQYGVIHGMSLPLILYPSALLYSLSGLLVPEISAQHAAGNRSRIGYMTARVLHLTLIFAIGTAGVMFFNADILSSAIYSSPNAAFYIEIIAPLMPIMYIDIAVDGLLKGLDQQVSYMRYNIIDASLCVILVWFLVPIFAVKGYILVIFISECLNFFLSFRRLTIVSEVRIEFFKDIVIPLLCVICANLFKNLFFGLFAMDVGAKLAAAINIIFSAIVYLVLLTIFKAVDKEELKWVNKIISRR